MRNRQAGAEAPAEEDDSGDEGCPVEDDEDAMPENEPESWDQDENEETELNNDTMETGETNENKEETYA